MFLLLDKNFLIMKKILFSLGTLACTALAIAQESPKNVIIFIGDGFGTSAKTAGRMALGQGTEGKRITSDSDFQILALDKLKHQGSLTTHSRNSWITDSAPGASVYAGGVKIDNESVSFNVETGESVETILEKAKKEGYAVGLVTSTRITHATPSAFGSHIWFRDLENYIAAQYISSTQEEYEAIFNDPNSSMAPYDESRDWVLPQPKVGVEIDVLMGGGARFFLPKDFSQNVVDANGNVINDEDGNPVTFTGKRPDNVNLIDIAKARDYVYINSRDALMNLDVSQFTPENDTKFMGLFNSSHNSYEQDRQMHTPWQPSLPEMTEMAIEILKVKGGDKGFFLMVEGGRIDHLEHANNGGITVIEENGANAYTVDSDKPAYVGGGDANYSATPTTERHTDVFGSDYLIKEVLAFDYSIAKARKLLKDTSSKTLIFSTSDHECGGTAIVGLHDASNAQENDTFVRTYALSPRQNGADASGNSLANPSGLERGDIDFGAKNSNGWYPDYKTYTFQDRAEELWPKCDVNGRRIVVAYASNPLTNGNGTVAGSTPGNHTPMDVFVGSEDNVGGEFAGRISGVGQMDNTYLTQIMEDFLEVNDLGIDHIAQDVIIGGMQLYPNPSSDKLNIALSLKEGSNVKVEVFNHLGQLVTTVENADRLKNHNLTIQTNAFANGVYLVKATTDLGQFTKQLLIEK